MSIYAVEELSGTLAFDTGKKGYTIIRMILRALSEMQSDGLTTREISDACDISIYAARNWLTKLKEHGVVDCIYVNGRVVRWFII